MCSWISLSAWASSCERRLMRLSSSPLSSSLRNCSCTSTSFSPKRPRNVRTTSTATRLPSTLPQQGQSAPPSEGTSWESPRPSPSPPPPSCACPHGQQKEPSSPAAASPAAPSNPSSPAASIFAASPPPPPAAMAWLSCLCTLALSVAAWPSSPAATSLSAEALSAIRRERTACRAASPARSKMSSTSDPLASARSTAALSWPKLSWAEMRHACLPAGNAARPNSARKSRTSHP
mmetsp:Transcript_43457/g.140078  ORF Transcript_43457/g.140078 Transcript_43457/m.140078 type:complete len:234 (-) Transcript_43457:306-1007(-)